MDGWTSAAQSLPREHQCVRFVVIGHHRPLLGVYRGHSFHSRWADYDHVHVDTWRAVGEGTEPLQPLRSRPTDDR